jgi:uncharacterized protein (TIGR03000 family)
MLRRCFCLASVFAVAVLMLAADASQARERRLLGRRTRGNDSNYNNYDATAGYSTSTAEEVGQRRAFYYDPEVNQASMREMPVYVEVRIPAGAEIVIEGQKTTQTGSRRLFVSPPVAPGQNYTYEMQAKWMENGREVTQSRKVPVRAGQRVMVDLTKPLPSDQQQK